MSKISNRIAGLVVTMVVACSAGAAFAQSANGGGRGGDAGAAAGSGATVTGTTYATVPSNQQRPPQLRTTDSGPSCANQTDGRRASRLQDTCGPY